MITSSVATIIHALSPLFGAGGVAAGALAVAGVATETGADVVGDAFVETVGAAGAMVAGDAAGVADEAVAGGAAEPGLVAEASDDSALGAAAGEDPPVVCAINIGAGKIASAGAPMGDARSAAVASEPKLNAAMAIDSVIKRFM